MGGSTAKRSQGLGLTVLKHTLVSTGHAPKREFKSPEEFQDYFHKHKTVIIDATEQRTKRPGDRECQKQIRTGRAVQRKKITYREDDGHLPPPPVRYIHYVSKCWVGKSHDYRLLKHEFPPELNWFNNHTVRLDLGYQGFVKGYDCQRVVIPKKKPSKCELNELEKQENKEKFSERIMVEHAIGGMKRYRILSDRLRIHNCKVYNNAVEVCAGLWNFYLTK